VSEQLNPPPDLTDPQTLVHLLGADAQSLLQHADAVRNDSCAAGHPNPEFWFRQMADRMSAAVAMIQAAHPTRPAPAPQPAKTEPAKAEAPKVPPTATTPEDVVRFGDKKKVPVAPAG
jgi:hypothetical protein